MATGRNDIGFFETPIISDTIAKLGYHPYNLPFMNFTSVDLKMKIIN